MRRSAIKRRTPLKTTSSLKPGESLKRNPPKHVSEIVSFIWRRDLGPCVVCPAEGTECRGPVQGHHIVAAETLRKRGFRAYLMDLRNRLPVCEHRHEQHTTKYRPIPRAVLPASVFEFAAELGLTWYLDRHYPVAVSERGLAAGRPAERSSFPRSETAGEAAA